MDEHEPIHKKVDLNSEIGMSRRDLLRRSAVVGGTLLWVAPAIQTVGAKAVAQAYGPSPGVCAACYCWDGSADRLTVTEDEYIANGVSLPGKFTADDCENYCKWQSTYAGGGIVNGPFQYHAYCSGTACNVCTEEAFALGGCNGI